MKKLAAYLVMILLSAGILQAQDSLGVQKVGELYECWQHCLDLAVSGNYAYVAAKSDGLKVLDISGEGELPVVASYNETCSAVKIDGERLYLNIGVAIQILDISDPTHPTLIANYNLGNSNDVLYEVQDNLLFLCMEDRNDRNRLNTIDIIDMTNPEEPDSLTTIQVERLIRIKVDGNRIYYLDHQARLSVVGIENPREPRELGHIDNDVLSYGELCISGSTAFLPGYGAGMLILDVSDPAQIERLALIDSLNASYDQMIVNDGFGYIVSSERVGIRIVDVQNPRQPEFVETVFDSVKCGGIGIFGNKLVTMTRYYTAIAVFNIMDQRNLQLVATKWSHGIIDQVVYEDDLVYVYWIPRGLSVVDVRDKHSPIELSYIRLNDQDYRPKPIEKCGSFIYASYRTYEEPRYYGLSMIDVSDPSNIQIAAQDTFYQIWDLEIRGSIAYFVCGSDGLQIVDLQNPIEPQIIGSLQGEGRYLFVDVEDDLAYTVQLVNNSYSVRAIDISDPTDPREVGSCPTWRIFDLVANGNLVVASYSTYIIGIDFSDLQNPHVTMHSEGIPPSRILHKLSDSYVIAGNEELGFRVLKLGDEIGQDIQFTECGFYDTPGITDGIATDEYFTFIADRSNLGIYDISEALGWQSVGQHGPTATGQWELLSLFPNPFNSTLRIGFSMAKPGLATVSLFDLTGRRVSTLDRRYYSAGIQTLISDQIKLPAGCYFARVEAGGWNRTIPVNCIK